MIASIPDKLRGGLGAALIVALLGYMLVFGLPVAGRLGDARSITPISLDPPVRLEIPRHPRKLVKARAVAARPSPPNRRNKASAIIVPPPIVPPLIRPPLVAAAKAGPGAAVFSGASDRPGAGEGAGGTGDGTGAGGAREGDGADDGDVPPRLIRGRLRFADLPPGLRGVSAGGTVSVRYDVGTQGRVSNCTITGSSGDPALDSATCDLIERKFRYEPSRSPDGEAVASSIEESHRWEVAHAVDSPPED